MNTVSVIIPTWNRAETLVAAVYSALNQTYPVLEVLICDDGSTDDSRKLIASIPDNRIKWIDCGRNGRPAPPRNRGAQESKGEWLAFLDSDDEWFTNKLEEQLKVLKMYPECLAISSNAQVISKDGKNKKRFHTTDRSLFHFKDLVSTNMIICSSALVHRTVFEKAGGFPEAERFKAIEDYVLWLKIAVYTNWRYIGDPLLNYLDHPTESIRATDLDGWKQRYIVFSELFDWCSTNTSIPGTYKALVKKELLLARFKTSKSSLRRLFYRIRYALHS
jgi:glycosyltransferase involved in cell wall biosynthesis